MGSYQPQHPPQQKRHEFMPPKQHHRKIVVQQGFANSGGAYATGGGGQNPHCVKNGAQCYPWDQCCDGHQKCTHTGHVHHCMG